MAIQKLIKILGVSLSLGVFTGFFIPTHAEAAMLRNSVRDTYIFGVPEGGWSSMALSVVYLEDYTPNGGSNNFDFRQRTYYRKTTFATTKPTVHMLSITHSSGRSFTSYTTGDVMYDPNAWEYGSAGYNRDSVTYPTTTNVTGSLPFVVICDGGLPAQYAGSVNLSLKTN